MSVIAADLPTLLGVVTGIFVLAGLICMVLHLFSKTKYPRTRHFADAHSGPPVMFASDTGEHCQLHPEFVSRILSFSGIPLTIQSNRPSSRSSQRSSGSIGSYTGRRSSGAPHSKGVNVSQSRQGAARSAAILLYSYHLNNLRDGTSSCPQSFNSNKFMAKYIEQQLEDQKKLLYLDIPTLRNHNTLMRKLHLNPRSEIDLTLLEKQAMGDSPLHRRLHRRFFKQSTSDKNTDAGVVMDERSGVDGIIVDKSTEGCHLNGSSNSNTHNVSFITDGGYTNPLAYSINDLDDDSEDDYDSDECYHQSFLFDNQEVFFGAMPTPCSEGPSIAVWKMNEMKTNDRCHKLSLSVSQHRLRLAEALRILGRMDEILFLLVLKSLPTSKPVCSGRAEALRPHQRKFCSSFSRKRHFDM